MLRMNILHRVVFFWRNPACKQLTVVVFRSIECQAAAESARKCRKLPLGFKTMHFYSEM
jgi:hypothetical protein